MPTYMETRRDLGNIIITWATRSTVFCPSGQDGATMKTIPVAELLDGGHVVVLAAALMAYINARFPLEPDPILPDGTGQSDDIANWDPKHGKVQR